MTTDDSPRTEVSYPPTAGFDFATDRIYNSSLYEARSRSVEPPTREQIAVVLSALADYTLIQAAEGYDRWTRAIGDEKPTRTEDTATSVGRFFHAVSDAYRDESRKQVHAEE